MANGCSGTPLARKLGVGEGAALALVAAPEGWAVPDLPPGVVVRGDLRGRPGVIVAFVRSRAELRRASPRLVGSLRPGAWLWVAWPRRAGGHDSDVTEQSLRDELLPRGLVDTKVAALDGDWSGLRFGWRRSAGAVAGPLQGRGATVRP